MFAPSDCVLDHVEYVIDRVGIEHVALGSDFDGWLATIPNDMKDCRDITKILDGLKSRGFSEDEIAAITHENALRVLSHT
jgi:membrane dipeptidase